MSAKSIHNLIRGLSAPYVGAHFINKGQVVKVWKSVKSLEGETNMEPGKVIRRTDHGPIIKCGEGSIILLKTEPEFWKPEGDYL
jgi:methionyl-tRNA formyltransferase